MTNHGLDLGNGRASALNKAEGQQIGGSFFGISRLPVGRLRRASNLLPSPHLKSFEAMRSTGSVGALIEIVLSSSLDSPVIFNGL